MVEHGERHQREYRITGMDCQECVRHVQSAIAAIDGVDRCDVYLASERAVVHGSVRDVDDVDIDSRVRAAVEAAGYRVDRDAAEAGVLRARTASRKVLVVLAGVSVAVLLLVVLGEFFGLLDGVTDRLPWYVSLAIILVIGRAPFLSVIRNAVRGQVVSHTLMTVGALAAALAGEWSTAAIVVVFMRVGSYAESATTNRSRKALRDLSKMLPRTARRRLPDGGEDVVDVTLITPGELVIVRPGDAIPTDGEVREGDAYVNQAAITGESQPVSASPGTRVFAASTVSGGSLLIEVSAVGINTTFARVIALVEDAELNRAHVQRIADRFSGYYLPVVAVIAALAFFIGLGLESAIAVLVVACSCSFALATPIAMLASIGSAARSGVLIKGGATIEALDRVSVLLLDKTGTITTGLPRLTDVVPAPEVSSSDLLQRAASVERNSEHAVAEAIRRAAFDQGLDCLVAEGFRATPGVGVWARINGVPCSVGRAEFDSVPAEFRNRYVELAEEGKTVLMVHNDHRFLGLLATADTVRPGIAVALERLRSMGINRMELITGDNAGSARRVADELGLESRSGLMPGDKIGIVREYQAQGHRVAMIGDGVNDAPALAGADVGIAMGAAGTDIAIESAHVALMADDWDTVPMLFLIARRTMRVVRLNIGFTALYNLVGLSLAALGLLPPVVAAAAQSLPDLGILANSSRLLRSVEKPR